MAIILCVSVVIPRAGAGKKNVVKEKVGKLAGQIKKAFKSRKDKDHKTRIAIISFDNVGPQAKKQDIGRGITELLTTDLVQSGLFIVLERKQLEKVLKEQSLSLTGLIDPRSASQVGKLLGAEAILCGTVSEMGDFYDINARVIDVQTAEILTTALVDIKRDDLTKELKTITLVVEARSPVTALLYSSMLPGLGQWYNGQPLKAVTMGILTLGTLGVASDYSTLGDEDYDEYNRAKTNSKAKKLYDDAQKNYDMMEYFQYVFLGFYLYNIADAYFTARKARKAVLKADRGASIEFRFAEDSRGGICPMIVYARRF